MIWYHEFDSKSVSILHFLFNSFEYAETVKCIQNFEIIQSIVSKEENIFLLNEMQTVQWDTSLKINNNNFIMIFDNSIPVLRIQVLTSCKWERKWTKLPNLYLNH